MAYRYFSTDYLTLCHIGGIMPQLIGRLVDGKVYCLTCEEQGISLYDINILPYTQTCSRCQTVIIQGSTSVILFVERD